MEDLHEAPLKIAVCLPTHDMIPSAFMYDYGNLMAFTGATIVGNGQADIVANMVQGTYIHTARQDLALRAITQDVSHLLWLDTDMRFPKDALVRLLMRKKPVVGINYATRKLPLEYVAIKEVGVGKGGRCATTDESTGLEEVEALGFGMVLMQAQVLECMPLREPWFWYEWLEGRFQVGEDVYFCNLLREGGHKIYVDHDLSKECAHIGSFEYHLGQVEDSKAAAAAESELVAVE